MPKLKAKPGDVVQVELGDGRFAYARVLLDASVAVYRSLSDRLQSPPIGEREFLFTVGIYSDLPGSPSMPIVGYDGFASEDEAWPPPYKVVDRITQRVRVYYRGEMRAATNEAATADLEPAAVWDLHQILERIRKAAQERSF